MFDKAGIYTVTLLSTDLATKTIAIDSIKISVKNNQYFSSREFTPNGDGDKDFYTLSSKRMRKMTAQIFDSNGTLVYQYEGVVDGKWDGKDNKGKDVKDGLYWVIISGDGKEDGKLYESKASVYLRR